MLLHERIKEVSALVFERSKESTKNNIFYDDKTLQTLTINALKLLPLPLRIFLKKNNCSPLKDELSEILRKHGLVITSGSDSSRAERTQRSSVKEAAVPQTPDPICESDENIAIPAIETEMILDREKELQKEISTFVKKPAEDEKSAIESTKALSCIAIKQAEKHSGEPAVPINVTEPVGSMPVVDRQSQRTNYMKFAIIGITIIFLILAGFFVKSYLSKPAGQAEKEIVSKPPSVQPVKPIYQPKPAIEQPKEQPPATAAERPSKPDTVNSTTSPMERPIAAQKVKKQETASSKQKSSAAPESTREPEPKKQEKKSFAPHSRDDL